MCIQAALRLCAQAAPHLSAAAGQLAGAGEVQEAGVGAREARRQVPHHPGVAHDGGQGDALLRRRPQQPVQQVLALWRQLHTQAFHALEMYADVAAVVVSKGGRVLAGVRPLCGCGTTFS